MKAIWIKFYFWLYSILYNMFFIYTHLTVFIHMEYNFIEYHLGDNLTR